MGACESNRKGGQTYGRAPPRINYYGPTTTTKNNTNSNFKRNVSPEKTYQKKVANPFIDNTSSQINFDRSIYKDQNQKQSALNTQNLKDTYNYKDPLISTNPNIKSSFPTPNKTIINNNQSNLIANSNIGIQNSALNSQMQNNLIPSSFIEHSTVKNSNINNNLCHQVYNNH